MYSSFLQGDQIFSVALCRSFPDPRTFFHGRVFPGDVYLDQHRAIEMKGETLWRALATREIKGNIHVRCLGQFSDKEPAALSYLCLHLGKVTMSLCIEL